MVESGGFETMTHDTMYNFSCSIKDGILKKRLMITTLT